ncbi:hypothetical protein IFR05_006090 [Cadophora sp. M221]|nr:hypothetical protein IFR05_006090 [Cadophora sp. M221]
MGKGVEAENMLVHAMKVRKKILSDKDKNTLSEMAIVGLAFNLNGRWDKAKELLVQVMETRKTKLGVDHPSTLTSIANLASTYRNQGRWDDAEKLFVQVMETSKTKLGVDHLDTLTSMNNLAFTWKENGKETKAFHEMYHVKARTRKYGAVPRDYRYSLKSKVPTRVAILHESARHNPHKAVDDL